MRHIQQRSIIFINEHHHLLASLLINGIYQIVKSNINICFIAHAIEPCLLLFNNIQQITIQLLLLHMLTLAQVEVQNRISIPLLLQLLDGKPLEQFLLSLEITLEGGNQQRLAETAWATQEEIRSIRMSHTIDIFRLIYIELILLADPFKCLNSYRI